MDGSEGSGGSDEEWEGLECGNAALQTLDQKNEYEDEDQMTTVTIEAVEVTKEGLKRVKESDSEGEENDGEDGNADGRDAKKSAAGHETGKAEESVPQKKKWWASKGANDQKKKKKKFRYENKVDRKASRLTEPSNVTQAILGATYDS